MKGIAARAALARMFVAHDDHAWSHGALLVVMNVDAKIRHVLLLTGDEGVVIGDSSLVDACDVTCLRCGTHGHRSDVCDRPGVMLSDRVRRQRKNAADRRRKKEITDERRRRRVRPAAGDHDLHVHQAEGARDRVYGPLPRWRRRKAHVPAE